MYSRPAVGSECIRPAGSAGCSMLCCSLPCGRREWRELRHNWKNFIVQQDTKLSLLSIGAEKFLVVLMGWCKRYVTPLLTYWSYAPFALSHRYYHNVPYGRQYPGVLYADHWLILFVNNILLAVLTGLALFDPHEVTLVRRRLNRYPTNQRGTDLS